MTKETNKDIYGFIGQNVGTQTPNSNQGRFVPNEIVYLKGQNQWDSPLRVEYLVVAGGGNGGGGNESGGGGAGGFRNSVQSENTGDGGTPEAVLELVPGTYGVTVGGAGADSVFDTNGVVSTITSEHGGNANAGNGGSGAGGAGSDTNTGHPGGSGTANQGNDGGQGGGQGGVNNNGGGGGGGSGNVGSSGRNTHVGGGGGNGQASSIYDGNSATYAGGGAGSGHNQNNSNVSGGNGGGGRGGTNGTSGTANTGGGGGAGRSGSHSGGSGVVILRYTTSDASSLSISGGGTNTYGNYSVHRFTSSGNFVIS